MRLAGPRLLGMEEAEGEKQYGLCSVLACVSSWLWALPLESLHQALNRASLTEFCPGCYQPHLASCSTRTSRAPPCGHRQPASHSSCQCMTHLPSKAGPSTNPIDCQTDGWAGMCGHVVIVIMLCLQMRVGTRLGESRYFFQLPLSIDHT